MGGRVIFDAARLVALLPIAVVWLAALACLALRTHPLAVKGREAVQSVSESAA